MKSLFHAGMVLLAFFSATVLGGVAPLDINGARNTPTDGTTMDTNVSFSLRMTLAGDATLRDSAAQGQDVDIRTIIHPETGDAGKLADIFIVDYLPPVPYMRDTTGNFVPWNGNLGSLVPDMENVTLTDGLDVDVFSGQLGTPGLHRIFVGFLVGDALYFTPSSLQITIEDTPAEPTPLEQARTLFESVISPNIIQRRCIACHVPYGIADNPSSPVFARTSYPDHLNYNFDEFVWLKSFRSSKFLLYKVRGISHEGGIQLFEGSSDYNSLVDFLDLLDQASQ